MKLYYVKNILLLLSILMLVGCGINANLSFTTTPGSCAAFNIESTSMTESAPAPYCMQVTMTNNGGGSQNFLNSTTAAISNLNMTVTGATNISTPANAGSSMDPNNCMGSSINPGNSCTFYLQISKESYAVNQNESVTLNVSYNVQNTLFGGSTSNSSSTLNFFEVTNLYIPEANGDVTIYNNSSTPFTTVTGLFKTNNINLQSAAIDNSNYGYLYLGGSNGVYLYGEKTASPSNAINGITGASNLVNSNGSIYATPGSNAGVYQWTMSSMSWANTSSPTFTMSVPPNQNTHALSASGNIYLAAANRAYYCNNSSGNNTGACNPEGVSLGSNINALTYVTPELNTTGLYAGTNNGLFSESGTTNSSTNSWIQVPNSDGSSINTQINSMVIDSRGNIYAGDTDGNNGNIWLITYGQTSATKLYTLSGSGIQFMRVDMASNTLYFLSTSGSLYSCSLGIVGGSISCFPSLVPGTSQINAPIGMKIGSELKTAL